MANSICACPDETLIFTCSVSGRATIWGGSAFDCPGNSNEIQFLHSSFDNSKGDCNGGAILGQSLGINGTCYISQLNVPISPGLNNKTVMCSNNAADQVGTSLITVTGIYMYQ